MYGIFTYIWLILKVNVGEIYHTLHGSYGISCPLSQQKGNRGSQ